MTTMKHGIGNLVKELSILIFCSLPLIFFEHNSLHPMPVLPQLSYQSPLKKLFAWFSDEQSSQASHLIQHCRKPKEGNKMFNILAGTEAERTKIPSLPSEVPNVVGGTDTSINNWLEAKGRTHRYYGGMSNVWWKHRGESNYFWMVREQAAWW